MNMINRKKIVKLLFIVMLISLVLVGCKGKDIEESKGLDKGNNLAKEEQIIDESTGLVFTEAMEVKFAESFSVDYYEGGYKKLTDWTGGEILLIPEGKEIPEGMKDSVKTIKLPIKTLGAFSTPVVTELRPIGMIDVVSLVTTKEDRWHIEEIKEGMASGKIVYAGKNSEPDFELIEANKPDLILLTSGTTHGGDEVVDKFDELGINWMPYGSHRERDPRGRLEWLKYVSTLFDKEKEAIEYFDGELSKIEKIIEETKDLGDKQTFATTFLSGDLYYVRNKGDYEVKMMEIAGGDYIFKDLNPDQDGNTKMNTEEFYKGAENADILFYNNINGPSIQSIEELTQNADYLKDMKAVKEKNVWGFKPHYYQSSDHAADIIHDLHIILTSPKGEITETDYYFLMD